MSQTTKVQSTQIANIAIFVTIILVVVVNAIISLRLVKSIQAAKQEQQTQAVNQQAESDQTTFFSQNQELLTTLDRALPDQTGIISMIETVEELEKRIGVGQSFDFTSTKPSQEANQYYLPFTIKLNANFIQTMDFFRRFEKLPYLTKIISVNIKSPAGLSGLFEVAITGRVYVQDAFKNQ